MKYFFLILAAVNACFFAYNPEWWWNIAAAIACFGVALDD